MLGMTRKPVIAIAPIRYYDSVQRHNLPKIKEYIAKAKKHGADIVCFPESCITKYGSVFLNGSFITGIREECKKHSIWSIITEDTKIGKRIYNISILIDREGKIRGRYKKINLLGDNNSKAGNRVRVFDTDFARIGIVICWDLTFPGLFDKMKRMGAEIVFCPSAWNYDWPAHEKAHKKREIELLRALTLARAHENLFYIALCNPIVESKTQVSYSAISGPVEILKELIDEEGIIAARVDLSKLRKLSL